MGRQALHYTPMSPRPPNILLITSDQQHYDTLGFANPHIQTPNLDRLAREGANFTRAYCPNPLCSPTRASIITGLYPSAHGCWTLGTKLMEDVPTVGDALQAVGYQTSLIGKAHLHPLATAPGYESIECQPVLRDLDFWRNFRGPWYGFRYVETARMHADEAHAGGHYGIWMEEKGLKNWRDYFQNYPSDDAHKPREGKWDLPQEFHYTTWTAEKTIDYIRMHVREGHPFFTWASFHDPHPPYLVPEPWASMYRPEDMEPGRLEPGEMDRMPPAHRLTQQSKPDFSPWRETPFWNHGYQSHLHSREYFKKHMAIYYGMISFMDQQIGRILAELDRLKIADNTLVIFTTDHGHFLGQHGLIFKGAFHYEDLVRVPFLARYPGRIPAGSTNAALVSLVDLAPTFLRLAGQEIPGTYQGVDQMPVWEAKAPAARNHVIVENRHQPTKLHLRTYIDARYKMTVYRNQPYGELFDLQEDPREVHNRWDDPACADVKREVMHRFLNAELQREPLRMPRICGA